MMNQAATPARCNAASLNGSAAGMPVVASLLFNRNLAWLS